MRVGIMPVVESHSASQHHNGETRARRAQRQRDVHRNSTQYQYKQRPTQRQRQRPTQRQRRLRTQAWPRHDYNNNNPVHNNNNNSNNNMTQHNSNTLHQNW